MKKDLLWVAWGLLFVACTALGLLTREDTAVALKNILALVFFLPGAILLGKGDRKDAGAILWLSAASLILTTVLIIAGTLTARYESALLTFVTAVVSAPMYCCTVWAMSLFLWACLLFGSMKKKTRKPAA